MRCGGADGENARPLEGGHTRNNEGEIAIGTTHDTTAINDETIEMVVHTFYARVRTDTILGPLFSQRVADWDVHVQRMCLFWTSVLFLQGPYDDQALRRRASPEFSAPQLRRWLELFRQSAREVCPGTAAELFIGRAEVLAASVAPLSVGAA